VQQFDIYFLSITSIWVHEASFSELNRASWFLCCCRKIYALLKFHLNVLLGDMGLWCCGVFCLCNYLFIYVCLFYSWDLNLCLVAYLVLKMA